MDVASVALRPSHSGSIMLSYLNDDVDEQGTRHGVYASNDNPAYHDQDPYDSYQSDYTRPALPSYASLVAGGDRRLYENGDVLNLGELRTQQKSAPGGTGASGYPPSEHSSSDTQDNAASLSSPALSGVSPASLGVPSELPQILSPLAFAAHQIPQVSTRSLVHSPFSAASYTLEDQPPQQYISPSELSSDYSSDHSRSHDADLEPCTNRLSMRSSWYNTVLQDTPTQHVLGTGYPAAHTQSTSDSHSRSVSPYDNLNYHRERSSSWSRGGKTTSTPPINSRKASRTSFSSVDDESPSAQSSNSDAHDVVYDSLDSDDDYSPSGASFSRKRTRAMREDGMGSARPLQALEADSLPFAKRSRTGVPESRKGATKRSRGRKVPYVSMRTELTTSNSGESLTATRGGPVRGRGGGSVGSGKRQFRCMAEGCGKLFVRKEHLKRHVKSLHTEDKPHVCPHAHCGKRFSRRDNLGQHVRIHA
ncbi:hypothetical protein HDZ31DRAFT_49395 [Schizophyllum fasciatum]